MIKDNYTSTPLHWAACYGHLDQVPKGLLTEKTMLVIDIQGNTPLIYAAQNGHLDRLLGIDFGESAEFKKTVGEEWWAKHAALLLQKKGLEIGVEALEVELF